jgi:hypothetical protein
MTEQKSGGHIDLPLFLPAVIDLQYAFVVLPPVAVRPPIAADITDNGAPRSVAIQYTVRGIPQLTQ